MQQYNDEVIPVDLFVDGEAEPASNITAAIYKLYNSRRTEVLIEKSLGNGISPAQNALHIQLAAAELQNLNGSYYHELTIWHTTHGRKTLFSGGKKIKPTFN